MKALEKYSGINLVDIQQAGPAIIEVYTRLVKSYHERTHPKLKILDSLLVFCLLSFVIQIVYAVFAGKDPFNSLLAGLFCSLGQFALGASLRIQLSDQEFIEYSNKKAIAEFILGSFLLYLSCLCLIG